MLHFVSTIFPMWLPYVVPGVKVPDIGVRVTILVIAGFLLLVGAAMVGFRIMELREEADSMKSMETKENR